MEASTKSTIFEDFGLGAAAEAATGLDPACGLLMCIAVRDAQGRGTSQLSNRLPDLGGGELIAPADREAHGREFPPPSPQLPEGGGGGPAALWVDIGGGGGSESTRRPAELAASTGGNNAAEGGGADAPFVRSAREVW